MPSLELRIGSVLLHKMEGIVHVSDTTATCVAKLGTSTAARLQSLLAQEQERGLSPADYNCLGAAAFLLGQTDDLTWKDSMPTLGTEVSDDTATADTLTRQSLFQIIGNIWEANPGGIGRRWKMNIVLHAGLLLRNFDNGELAVLEKYGALPLTLRPWKETYGEYFPGKRHHYGTALRLLPLDEIPSETGH